MLSRQGILAAMKFPNFSIPASLDNMTQHPHGARMLAACVALEMPYVFGWSPMFLRRCPDEIGREFFCTPTDHIPESILFARGWLDPHHIETIATSVADMPSWDDAAGGITQVELANPAISRKLVGKLLKAQDSPGATDAIAALYANPNCEHGHELATSSLSKEGLRNYVRALAKHGDLSNPDVEGFLRKNLLQGGQVEMSTDEKLTPQQHLADRDTLTPGLCFALDSFGVEGTYERLIRNPMHELLVKRGTVDGHNISRPHLSGQVLLSAALTKEKIAELWSQAADPAEHSSFKPGQIMAVLAAHENASPEMCWTACTKPDITADYGVALTNSKKTGPQINDAVESLLSQHMITGATIASIAGLSRDCLLEAALKYEGGPSQSRDHQLVAVCSHPNFPWKDVPPDHAIRQKPCQGMPIIELSAALRGKLDVDPRWNRVESEHQLPMLFNPTLSGHRLAKIAEKHPALAGLAALHPNGADVSIKNLPSEERVIVGAIRANLSVSLSGRSSGATPEPGNVLVI